MGNGCDPDLRLRLGIGNQSSSANSDSMRLSRVADWIGNTTMYHQQPPQHQRQHQITIFYNGRTSAVDVTEIQARAIICMAMREMEARSTEKKSQSSPSPSPSQSQPSSPTGRAPQLINPGQSMKRSLKRFLEKRKTRMDAASPYHCTA